jgi:hypothetical protein
MLLAGRSGDRNSARSRDFFFSKNVQTGPGAQPTTSSMGTEIISRRVKRPKHEVDLAEVMNEWKYTSVPFTGLYGYILSNGEKIVEKGKDFVGIDRGLIKEIYRYFPAGTTAKTGHGPHSS